MNKTLLDAHEAIKDICDGSILAIGGFGLCGIPENCLRALAQSGVQNLTCISNNAGVDGFGIGLLLENRQIKKIIASYIGENKLFEKLLLNKEIDVQLTPQGTLAEALRIAGVGIPAFYTATGVGTLVEKGKDTREFQGRKYLLEEALSADFGLVKAYMGDTAGNLIFRKTARNFNPLCAMASRHAIAEVEVLVEAGSLDPDHIHLPGIYVHSIFQGKNYEKPIEKKCFQTTQTG